MVFMTIANYCAMTIAFILLDIMAILVLAILPIFLFNKSYDDTCNLLFVILFFPFFYTYAALEFLFRKREKKIKKIKYSKDYIYPELKGMISDSNFESLRWSKFGNNYKFAYLIYSFHAHDFTIKLKYTEITGDAYILKFNIINHDYISSLDGPSTWGRKRPMFCKYEKESKQKVNKGYILDFESIIKDNSKAIVGSIKFD